MQDKGMQKKLVTVVVLAVSASALGGIALLTGGGADKAQAQAQDTPRLAANAPTTPDYFSTPEPVISTPERGDIDTRGRSGGAEASNRGGMPEFMARMSEFDLDGDGILSDEERRAMMRQMRDDRNEGMDLDGDGEVSREERREARLKRFEDSAWGQNLMRQFDLDGDGVLSPEEEQAMNDQMREQREQRREQQVAQYDTDGDGRLSREERQVQREDQRQRRDEYMQNMNEQFDRDGDGQLSIEESMDAWAAMQQRREIDQFVGRYDRNGDGSMGPADYDAFLSDYQRGDMSADVNRDGVINSQDLTAYTDMVARSRNRP